MSIQPIGSETQDGKPKGNGGGMKTGRGMLNNNEMKTKTTNSKSEKKKKKKTR